MLCPARHGLLWAFLWRRTRRSGSFRGWFGAMRLHMFVRADGFVRAAGEEMFSDKPPSLMEVPRSGGGSRPRLPCTKARRVRNMCRWHILRSARPTGDGKLSICRAYPARRRRDGRYRPSGERKRPGMLSPQATEGLPLHQAPLLMRVAAKRSEGVIPPRPRGPTAEYSPKSPK